MATSPIAVTPNDVRQLAAEVFVLGFPLLMMDALRRAHPVAANRFLRLSNDGGGLARGLIEEDQRIVQSSAMIDLADGPVVLHLPDPRDRYFLVTLTDSGAEPFASLGSHTREHGGPDIALVGPRWRGEVKRGLRCRRAPTDLVWAVSRIAAHSLGDVANAESIAGRQSAVPLLNPSEPGPAAPLRTLEPAGEPLERQVAALAPHILMHRLSLTLERAPAAVRESIGPALADRLEALAGYEAAHETDPIVRAMSQGFADALQQIASAAETAEPGPNGWTRAGDVGAAPDALARAGRVLARLGAPAREDVLTLNCVLDESGRPLQGTERYRIHFHSGGLPPAESSWRLAVLPAGNVEHVDPSYGAIGDRSELVFNRDESLELIIQAKPPNGGKGHNWVRCPPGPFRLAVRLFWPNAAALEGDWQMPPVERLGSRFARGAGGRAAPRGGEVDEPPHDAHSPPLPAWRISL